LGAKALGWRDVLELISYVAAATQRQRLRCPRQRQTTPVKELSP